VEDGRDIVVKSNGLDSLKQRLKSLLENRRDLVVFIRGVPEISRPMALEMLSATRQYVVSLGGSWEEEVQALHVSSEYVVLAVKVRIRVNDSHFEVVEVGECSKEEKAGGTLARVAYTRAVKRLLESLVGEDFINKILLQLVGTEAVEPATENQKNYLKNLIERGRITKEMVETAKQQGLVRSEFVLDEEGSWDKKSVSALIDLVRSRR